MKAALIVGLSNVNLKVIDTSRYINTHQYISKKDEQMSANDIILRDYGMCRYVDGYEHKNSDIVASNMI